MKYGEGQEGVNMRDEKEMNALIAGAVTELLEAFGEDLSVRDRGLLESVIIESDSNPIAKVQYLVGLREAVGVSERMPSYISQILQTLRQTFTKEEQERFKGWGKSQNLLNEIT